MFAQRSSCNSSTVKFNGSESGPVPGSELGIGRMRVLKSESDSRLPKGTIFQILEDLEGPLL